VRVDGQEPGTARWSIDQALKVIAAKGDAALPEVKKILEAAAAKYDADEA